MGRVWHDCSIFAWLIWPKRVREGFVGLKMGSLESKYVAFMRRIVMHIMEILSYFFLWQNYIAKLAHYIIKINMNEREEESGGAHGWVLGSRNSCEHMCFLPFVLCFVGPFFMPSHLNSTTAHKSVVLLLTGLYFSVRFFRLYIIVLSL